MKYTIITIDNSREEYKRNIRQKITTVPEVFVECVDGRVPGVIEKYLADNPWLDIPSTCYLTRGEIGVWLSVINVLKQVDETTITIEDDAVVHPEFSTKIFDVEFPEGMDFFSLFVPRDHDDWFYYKKELDGQGNILNPKAVHWEAGYFGYMTDNPAVVKPYQRYGGVSMVYTPKGAKRILKLLERDGIIDQYDNYLYQMARLGELDGYTHHPKWPDLVWIKGGRSLTHESEIYEHNSTSSK